MSTTHTPGPWQVCESRHKDVSDSIRTIGGNEEKYIAFVEANDVGHAVARANARVIAATPDLFKALEFITRCAKFAGPCGTTLYAISDAAMAEARAAISKATL